MTTRKELIDGVREEQRQRSLVAQGDQTKLAIVGIGDRDALTGSYGVLLPDGAVEVGEKQFNASLPTGSRVLGIPKNTGGWTLDEKDVKNVAERKVEEIQNGVMVFGSTQFIQTTSRIGVTALIPDPKPQANYDFLNRIIQRLCKGRKIYTLPKEDSRIYQEPGDIGGIGVRRRYSLFPESGDFVSGIGVAIESLAAKNIRVIPIDLETESGKVRGVFYLPLMNFALPVNYLQSAEIAALKRIAKSNVVIIQGVAGSETTGSFSYFDPLLKDLGRDDGGVANYFEYLPTSKTELVFSRHPLVRGLNPMDCSDPNAEFSSGGRRNGFCQTFFSTKKPETIANFVVSSATSSSDTGAGIFIFKP